LIWGARATSFTPAVLDEVNVQLPPALALLGAGPITIQLTVNGQASNRVMLQVN
jgi:hypothetical protein